MTGGQAGTSPPPPPQPGPAGKELLASTNDAAKHISTMMFAFIAACIFIGISVSSTTDDRLLMGRDFALPVFDVTVHLEAFFVIAPLLVVLLHLHLLLLEHLLAHKIARLPAELVSDGVAAYFYPALPVNVFVGSGYGRFIRGLLRTVQFAANVVLPLGLLFWIQIRFLPYHSVGYTAWHQMLVLADLAMIWFFYVRTTRLLAAVGPAATPSPRWRGLIQISFGLFSLGIALLCIGAIVPGTLWERWTPPLFPAGRFDRRISVRGLSLVRAAPPVELEALRYQGSLSEEDLLPRYTGLKLENRDLRDADFTDCRLLNAEFRNVDLRGAHFSGADLRGARFLPGREDRAFLDPPGPAKRRLTATAWRDRKALEITRLGGAWFVQADLRDARFLMADLEKGNFYGADLRNAELLGSDLRQANLAGASLQGTELALANLRGASLRKANLLGASLREASLIGADLTQAVMRAADLSGARLQGATFTAARLEASDFQGAETIGTSFQRASLQGTTGLELSGVDLAGAEVNGLDRCKVRTPPTFTDFRGLDFLKRDRALAKVQEWLQRLRAGSIKASAQRRLLAQQKRETCLLLDPLVLSHRQVLYEEVDRKGPMQTWPPVDTLGLVRTEVWSAQAYFRNLAVYLVAEQACRDEHVAMGMAYRIAGHGSSLDPTLAGELQCALSKALNDPGCAERETLLATLSAMNEQNRYLEPKDWCPDRETEP